MQKSTYDIVKMAILVGREYESANHDLMHARVDCCDEVAPRSQKTADVLSATIQNLTKAHSVKMDYKDALTELQIVEAKMKTLLWIVSDHEFMEDVQI